MTASHVVAADALAAFATEVFAGTGMPHRAAASSVSTGTDVSSSSTFTGTVISFTCWPSMIEACMRSLTGTLWKTCTLPSCPCHCRSTDTACSTKRGRQPSAAKGAVRWNCAPTIWASVA